VAGPLQKVADAAGGVAEGDYDQVVPLEGPAEVRQVAGSFNTMAARVKTTQQAQRDFVANVSHDLKTPITAISGWSQALLDGAASSDAEREHAVETIHTEAGRMQRMVNELLDLARLESGQLQLILKTVDLSEILAGVHRSFRPVAADKGIALVYEAAPVGPINGDPDRLTQVFANLVDNALAYSPPGSQVTLSTTTSGGWIEGVVRDTGPGIPPDEIDRIFERFYRLEKSRVRSEQGRGAGLGLSIVRELVEAHGGTVYVSSPPGEGTTFTVRLPAASGIAPNS
jgi:signal transduction histidine kinase